MPTLFTGALIGLCSAIGCATVGQITLTEALAIYAIVGTTAVMMLAALPQSDYHA